MNWAELLQAWLELTSVKYHDNLLILRLLNQLTLVSCCSEASIYFIRSDVRLGGRYKKVLFVEYLDQNFTVKKTRSSDEVHLGFLGPVIRAEVGDEIVVVFRNKVRF